MPLAPYRGDKMDRRAFLLTALIAAQPAIAAARTRRSRFRTTTESGRIASTTQAAVEWPIAKNVFTTAQQQVLPVALSADTPKVNPKDVPFYEKYGYSAWRPGAGTNYSHDHGNPQPYDKRTELAPDYANAPLRRAC